MREISLGQYYPTGSLIHKLDPRTKLLITIAYIVMIFFIDTFVGFGLVFIGLMATVLISKIPVTKILKSLKAIIFLLVFTVLMTLLFYGGDKSEVVLSWWIFTFYKQQLIDCGLIACRLFFMVLGPTMLTFTTTPVQLTDGMQSLLKPLALIKVPVHLLAIIMSITLRFIPSLSEETDKIINAQKSRCADFESGNIFKRAKAMIPILIPLLTSSIRRAEELACAMDSRCFKDAKNRTRMNKLKFGWFDPVCLILFCALFFVVLWLKFNFLPFVDLTSLGWIV
ncbi:MAG: energy-coupling factor transporter transmembrane protein EcfT [Clostridia bacterium]|nr:energy-coupling factor transporter transmembrane protein EcfT [Clostridia bacterium]